MTDTQKLELAIKALEKIASKTHSGYCYANSWGLYRYNQGMNDGLSQQAQVAENALADIYGPPMVHIPEDDLVEHQDL